MRGLILKLQKSQRFEKVCEIAVYVFVFLYAFSLPAFSARSGWQYISYGFMALLIASSFIYIFLYSRFSLHWAMLFLPAFCLWALIGTTLYSRNFREWFTILLLVITFFVFFYSFKIVGDTKTIFNLVLFALLAFCCYFIYVYRRDLMNYRNFTSLRLGDYFDNVNAIGTYCVLGLGLSLYFVFFTKKKFIPIYLVSALIFAAVGTSTGSRTFLVDAVLVGVVALFVKFRKHPLICLFVIAGFVGASLLVLNLPFMVTMRNRLWNALLSVFDSSATNELSTTQRTLWQLYGLVLGSKNLIIGFGFDGFDYISGVGTYTHGNFAEMLCDYGIVGLLFYYGLITYFIYRFAKLKTNESLFLLGMVCIVFVLNSFLSVYYYRKWVFLFMAICASVAFQTDDEARCGKRHVEIQRATEMVL